MISENELIQIIISNIFAKTELTPSGQKVYGKIIRGYVTKESVDNLAAAILNKLKENGKLIPIIDINFKDDGNNEIYFTNNGERVRTYKLPQFISDAFKDLISKFKNDKLCLCIRKD